MDYEEQRAEGDEPEVVPPPPNDDAEENNENAESDLIQRVLDSATFQHLSWYMIIGGVLALISSLFFYNHDCGRLAYFVAAVISIMGFGVQVYLRLEDDEDDQGFLVPVVDRRTGEIYISSMPSLPPDVSPPEMENLWAEEDE